MGFIGKSINELINTEFSCSCGESHIAEIHNIAIGRDVLKSIPQMIEKQPLADGKLFDKANDSVLVVSDVNTKPVAADKVVSLLKGAGYPVKEYCFQNSSMHAEEKYCTELQEQLYDGLGLMIAVGSGSLNDITRYVAFDAKLPYYIVATAPSMDGYASNVSPIVTNNLKTTFICKCADAIIGDTEILATCPTKMIGAGLGDIIGKYLSINDWKMSHMMFGEYYCEEVAELVLYSVQKCVDNVPGLQKREPEALQYLMESLVLIGIAMSYIGVSRPASASEHHIAHFFEMNSIFSGEYGELHGTNVGMATCLIHEMYKEFLSRPFDYDQARAHAKRFDYAGWERNTKEAFGLAADEVIALYQKVGQNNPDTVLARIDAIEQHEKELRAMLGQVVSDTGKAPELLDSLGGLTSLKQYPFDRKTMKQMLLHAKDLRNRYAALQLFYDMGELEDLAEGILNRYYA